MQYTRLHFLNMNKILVLIAASLISFSSFAQYVEINTVNCKISDTEQKKIEKLVAYERMFCNDFFETSNNITVPVKINFYGKAKDYRVEK